MMLHDCVQSRDAAPPPAALAEDRAADQVQIRFTCLSLSALAPSYLT